MITDSLSSAGLNFLLPTNIQDRYQTGADLGSFGTVLKDRLGAISEDMDAIFEEAAATSAGSPPVSTAGFFPRRSALS